MAWGKCIVEDGLRDEGLGRATRIGRRQTALAGGSDRHRMEPGGVVLPAVLFLKWVGSTRTDRRGGKLGRGGSGKGYCFTLH